MYLTASSYPTNSMMSSLLSPVLLHFQWKLVKAIKDHLAKNPGQANELRFSGLFGSRQRTAAVKAAVASSSESEPSIPQSSVSNKCKTTPRRLSPCLRTVLCFILTSLHVTLHMAQTLALCPSCQTTPTHVNFRGRT
jgi:hypothetical protein